MSIKIGLIADIHADAEKLQHILAILETQHHVDRILCAGDLTGYGTQPNPVIDILRERKIPVVKGNHDSPSADITPLNADYLRALPLEWQGEFENKRLYMCHGIPGVPFIGITRKHFTDDRLIQVFMDIEADVYITAHTHEPLVIDLPDGRKVINPGAVYLDNYAILSLPELRVDLY